MHPFHSVWSLSPSLSLSRARSLSLSLSLFNHLLLSSIDRVWREQDRGAFFTSPGDEVYEDQIVGIHSKTGDLKVNICKAKQLTNMRSSGADEKSSTTPPMQLTLEDAVEYVVTGEFVEVTPDAIRMGKHPKESRFAKKK